MSDATVALERASLPGAPATPPGTGRRRAGGTIRWLGPMAPAVLLLVVFLAGPIAWGFYAAFTNVALTGTAGMSWIGTANFRRMLADPTFLQSVVLTVVFVGGSAVIGQNGLGLLIAILMRGRHGVFRGVVSGIVITAWVVPEIVAAFLWYAYLSDQGTVDRMLQALHLPSPPWLYAYPMLAVIVANIWRGTAFSMLVFSAAISDVPPDLLEAASVDGANPLQRLWHVMLPLMKRSILTNLMLITLQTLSVFTLVFAMTAGGPGTKSQILPIYMYQEAFKFYQLGYGAAVAVVLLLIGALFSLIYVRALKVEM